MSEDQDKVGLTAAELEALNDPDDLEGEGGEGEGGEDDIVDIQPNGGAPVEGKPTAKPADKPAEVAATGEEATGEADIQQFVPEFKAQSPENIDAITQQLDQKYEQLSDGLAERYESGDLTFTEYRKETMALDRLYLAEQRKLDATKFKAEFAQEFSQQSAEQKWQWEQEVFFKDNATFRDDPVLNGALSATLQSMYQDQANQSKSGLQLLREAANKVNARFNVIPTNKQTMADKRPDKPAQPQAARELPKTLSGLPVSDANVSAQGEFDHLDSLSGMALEAAVSKLSPDQQYRYYNG